MPAVESIQYDDDFYSKLNALASFGEPLEILEGLFSIRRGAIDEAIRRAIDPAIGDDELPDIYQLKFERDGVTGYYFLNKPDNTYRIVAVDQDQSKVDYTGPGFSTLVLRAFRAWEMR